MVRGEVKSVDNESLSLMVLRFCWAQYTFISSIERAMVPALPPYIRSTVTQLWSPSRRPTNRYQYQYIWWRPNFGSQWGTITIEMNVVWLENNSSDIPFFWIVLLGPGWRLGGYYSGRSCCWITLDRDILSTPLWMWPCHPVSGLSVNRAELCRYIYSRVV